MGKGAKDFRLWKACQRKQAFDTAEQAKQKGQEIYQCRYCGKWHRTSGINRLVHQVRNHRL